MNKIIIIKASEGWEGRRGRAGEQRRRGRSIERKYLGGEAWGGICE